MVQNLRRLGESPLGLVGVGEESWWGGRMEGEDVGVRVGVGVRGCEQMQMQMQMQVHMGGVWGGV